jgi:hypothetical protein
MHEGYAILPSGYSLQAERPGRLVLRRADGSTVATFAFSAFGPSPDSVRLAAEEDQRVLGKGGEEQEGGGR